MRFSLAVVLACTASVFSVEAAAGCSQYHKVVSREDCSAIAAKSGITVSKLKSLNTGINKGCTNLKIGERLCVKGSAPTGKTTKKTTAKSATRKATIPKKATTTKKTIVPKKATTTKKAATPKKTTAKTTDPAAADPAFTRDGLNYYEHLTVKVANENDFCLFLPSSPGGRDDNNGAIDEEAISKSEKSAIAFCSKGATTLTPGARRFPTNFINDAYFYKNTTAGYVQVTGTLNPEAYKLSPVDGGGQYDNHGRGSPSKSMCYGYKYYVNLIEPDRADFCIRCCDTYSDCNAGRSAYGCRRVVDNGIYDD